MAWSVVNIIAVIVVVDLVAVMIVVGRVVVQFVPRAEEGTKSAGLERGGGRQSYQHQQCRQQRWPWPWKSWGRSLMSIITVIERN